MNQKGPAPFKIFRIAVLATIGVAAGPAVALCGGGSAAAIPTCNRLINSGYSYVFTPGCESVDCGARSSSVTDDLEGRFWVLGEGDPVIGMGIDNGPLPALDGWVYIYPGYPASISGTWVFGPVDGCIDHALDPSVARATC